MREISTYYHDHTDESDEIILPIDPPDGSLDYLDVCRDLGVTWVYTRDLRESEYESNPELAIDRIREGPKA